MAKELYPSSALDSDTEIDDKKELPKEIKLNVKSLNKQIDLLPSLILRIAGEEVLSSGQMEGDKKSIYERYKDKKDPLAHIIKNTRPQVSRLTALHQLYEGQASKIEKLQSKKDSLSKKYEPLSSDLNKPIEYHKLDDEVKFEQGTQKNES